MMNRRGHIATTMLFFGALVLVGVSLFSFVNFKDDFSSVVNNFDDVLEQQKFSERYVRYVFEEIAEKAYLENNDVDNDDGNFEDDFRESFERLALERRLNDGISDSLFDKIESGEYLVSFERIEIKGIEIRSEIDGNEIKKIMDLNYFFVKASA